MSFLEQVGTPCQYGTPKWYAIRKCGNHTTVVASFFTKPQSCVEGSLRINLCNNPYPVLRWKQSYIQGGIWTWRH